MVPVKLQWAATSALQWDGMSTSTLVNEKPALGQELGIPSLLGQLEAGRAFLQGCKLWETLSRSG